MNPKRILIVDDDSVDTLQIERTLSEIFPSAKFSHQTTGHMVMSSIKSFKPDLIIMDVYLSACNGLKVLRVVRNFNIMTPAIFVTETQDSDNYNALIKRIVPKNNVLGVCYKPLKKYDILNILNSPVIA